MMKYVNIALMICLILVAGCSVRPASPTPGVTLQPIIAATVTPSVHDLNWLPAPDVPDLIHNAGWICNERVGLREGALYLAGDTKDALVENEFGQRLSISGDFRIRTSFFLKKSSSRSSISGGIAIVQPDNILNSEPMPLLQVGMIDDKLGVSIRDEQTSKLQFVEPISHLSDTNRYIHLDLIFFAGKLTLLSGGLEVATTLIPQDLLTGPIAFGIFSGPGTETLLTSLDIDVLAGTDAQVQMERPLLNLADLPTDLPLRCYAQLRDKRIGVAFNNFMLQFSADRRTLEKATREFDVVFPVGTFDFNITQPVDQSHFSEFDLLDPFVSTGHYRYKPGMSSLSSVKGRGDLTLQQKFMYDLIYAREANFILDIKLILQTIYVVVLQKGAK